MPQHEHDAAPAGKTRDEVVDPFRRLVAYGRQHDARRVSHATAGATDLVANLVTATASQPDIIVEDALCLRLGKLLNHARQTPVNDRPEPSHVAQALVTAAAAAVEATIKDLDALQAPWQVFHAVANILPNPDREVAAAALTRLRNNNPAGRTLPTPPLGPTLTGPALWTRDRYGSRFAVTAPFTTASTPERWYLWDIDACGHDAFTVHSGYYPTKDTALTAWQLGVGPIASAGTEFMAVDDLWLMTELLPTEEGGFFRVGGESLETSAEYHRGKRLADELKRALVRPDEGPAPDRSLDAATAAVEFAAWLRAQPADEVKMPDDLDEFATALAESWCFNHMKAVYETCSPHRVALCAQHIREYYLDDYGDHIVSLLPPWIHWLAARNGTPPELVDRCVPYAQGQLHQQIMITGDDVEPDYFARVIE